jgi:hypothetical protein
MAYFKRETFTGIAPALSPRLLAEEVGQTAQNIDFESGKLTSITEDSTFQSTASSTITPYLLEYGGSSSWIEYTADVSVVPGPIPGDTTGRVYWTGQTYPKVSRGDFISGGSTSYRLGIPAPSIAPTVGVGSVAADADLETVDVSYVYTFVSKWGEEGPPSPASTVIELKPNQHPVVTFLSGALPTLSGLNFGSGGGEAAQMRLYRSNTGSSETQFQLVNTSSIISYGATSHTDTTGSAALGEVLPSDTWIGPPDEDVQFNGSALYPDGSLQGLIVVAGGVMAGFVGKRFCLSEPFLPHAWPINYRITTEEDIVAIASTANGVAALTNGQPYFITGSDPSAMSAVRVDLSQACVNKDSVVDMGDYVLYASPDGLCAIQSASGRVVTEGQVSAKQWTADFYPTLIKAFKYEGTYVAFWTSGSTHGGWVYDPRGGKNSLSTITSDAGVKGGFQNLKDGELYIVKSNAIKKYRGSTTARTLTWKSKKYVTLKPLSMAYVSVDANVYPVVVKVYGDETLLAHYALNLAVTYVVTVVNSGGNKYVINGGSPAAVLTLQRGVTYTFDQSDTSNSNHPLRFKTAADASYSVGVVATGTPGQAGAKVVITVAADAPSSLKYYCTVHGLGMGNTINVINQSGAGTTLVQTTTVPTSISSTTLTESIMRLPSAFAQEWEIEVSGTDINEVCLAQSMDEIRNS